MRKVKKIMLMRLFFSQLNVCGRKHLAAYGRREIACANFSSPLRDKSLRNEESVKNNADAIIFHTTKCVAGNTFSYNRRAEFEIQLAFLRQQVPAEMRKVKKIMLMRLFFSQLNVCGRKHLAAYGRREIACANFSSPLRDKSLRNEE